MRYLLDFGLANAGQTPTFAIFKDLSTLEDLAQPLVYELGSGAYYFDLTFPLAGSPDTTTVVFKALCNGVGLSDTISSSLPVSVPGPLLYLLDFGNANVGLTPSFLRFQDIATLANLTAPSITEIGSGLYFFPYSFPPSDSPSTTTVAFVAAVNVGFPSQVNLSGTLSAVGEEAYPGAVSLSDLRDRVRQRADMQYSQFVTDSELNGYINDSARSLYGLLVRQYGEDYFEAPPFQITTDGVSLLFPLPKDFLKGLGVEMQVGAPNNWVTLDPFPRGERNRLGVLNGQITSRTRLPRYRFSGGNLWLEPLVASGQTVQIRYIPRFTSLVNDSDLFDGVNGWEEYIVVDAAIKALMKEDSDTTAIRVDKAELERRIVEESADRDAGEPQRVTDVYAKGGIYGRDDPYGGSW